MKGMEDKMEHCTWLDNLWNESSLYMPFNIELDSQYYSELNNKLNLLVKTLENSKAPETLISCSKSYAEQLTTAVELYYKGDIIESYAVVESLLDDCCNNNSYAISDVNSSMAFAPAYNGGKDEVQFFRARLNDQVVDFPAQEMLHIPFSKRSKVRSERFSIPGLPCLYLGNTSYVCWIEMGCPPDFRFNVSPVHLDNSQKVFNLAISLKDLYYAVDYCKEDREEKLRDLLKLFMINMATSFNVKEVERNFKSEYIISQMIMLACKKRKLDGITYHSKRVSNSMFAHIIGVNLALFAKYEGEESLSKICEHLSIGDSFNYSMFKQLRNSLKYKRYRLRIDNGLANNIGSFKRQFPYRETEFYEFDNYLFAFFDEKTQKEE